MSNSNESVDYDDDANEYPVSDLRDENTGQGTSAADVQESSGCSYGDPYLKETIVGNTSLSLPIPQCSSAECSNSLNAFCQCDPECIIYGDCCYSVVRNLTKQCLNMTVYQKAVEQVRKESKIGNYFFKCIGDVNLFNRDYYLIDECRTLLNDTVTEYKAPCSLNARYDYKDIPVDHVVDGKYISTFRNTYCAKCNGISLDELVSWNVQVLCQPSDSNITITPYTTLDDIDEINDCVIKPVSLFQPRKCNYQITRYKTCSDVIADDMNSMKGKICPLYIYPHLVSKIGETFPTIYRNMHCYTCENETNELDQFSCITPDQPGIIGPEYGYEMIDLQVVFRIKSNGAAVSEVLCGRDEVCDFNEVFDCLSKTCRKIHCSFGKVPRDGECVRDPKNLMVRDVTVPIDNSTHTYDGNILVLEIMFPTDGKSGQETELLNLKKIVFLNTIISNIDKDVDIHITSYPRTLLIIPYRRKNETIELLDRLLQAVNESFRVGYTTSNEYIFEITVQNYYDENNLCCLDGFIIHREPNATLDTDNEYIVFNLLTAGISVQNGDALWIFDVKYDDGNILYHPKLVYTCMSDDIFAGLNCTMVAFPLSKVVMKDNVIHILDINAKLPEVDVVIHGNKVYICADSVTNYEEFIDIFEHRQANRILSLTTSSLTIVGVLVVIVVHIVKKRLRNTHGLNLTALSFSILSIHVLLIAQIPTTATFMCYMYAVVLHFALLTMFTWTNIIGVDMTRIFLSNHIVSRYNPTKRFVANIILSILIPMIIVATSAALDMTNVSFRPKYANHGICWLSNGKGVLAFMVAPVISSFACNICCFTVTVVSIKRKSMQTEVVRKGKNQTYAIVFLKMTIILGFSWIVAIIGSMWERPWLAILNITLNGLQGVSILVCTIVNARNVRFLREAVKSLHKTSDTKVSHGTSVQGNDVTAKHAE